MIFENLLILKTKINWRILPVLIVPLFSCQENKSQIAEINIALVKIDSLIIQKETRIRILDHHSNTGNFLGYGPITKSFLLIDGKGKILEEVNRFGQGPNEYSANLSSAAFNEDGGGVFLQSSNELIWYDENWVIKNKWKYAPNFGVTIYGGPRFSTPYYFEKNSPAPLIFTSFFSNVKIQFHEEQRRLGISKIVEVFDSSKDKLDWKLPIDFSLYNEYKPKDNEFDLSPVYYLNKEKKVLLLSFDNSLTVGAYDMSSEFDLLWLFNFEKNQLSDKGNGKTVKIFQNANHDFVILRYSGIADLELLSKKEENSSYSPLQDSQLYRFYYVSEDKKVLKELPFPAGHEPNSELIILGEGKFLIRCKDDEDTEMNYSSYSVFEITVQNP